MKKFYFTRKNLIEIASVFLFFVVFLFTYACVEGGHSLFAKGNPIELFYNALNLPTVNGGATGYITAVLVVAFGTLADTLIIFLRRTAKFKEQKFFSFKYLVFSFLVIVLCLLLSLGVGMIHLFSKGSSVLPLLTLLGSTLLVSFLISLLVAAMVAAPIMLFVNFRNIDKPYRFFNIEELERREEIIDKEEREKQIAKSNLAQKFGEEGKAIGGNASGLAVGAGGAGGAVSPTEVAISDRQKVFPGLSALDIEYGGYEASNRQLTKTNLEELATNFRFYLADVEKLYFDIHSIRAFISSFAVSRIIILEGLSGTGKSSLPRYFAKFISAKSNFIPVQTTWRDKTSLIGYFNDFSQSFNETPFLLGLYRANYDKDNINLMVLDEFNIARVEYYFADFLSILEYPQYEQVVKVMQLPHGFVPPTQLQDGLLRIEPNTFFVCTANKDDSTYSISDKVYDRAIILDFDDQNEPFEAKALVKQVPIGFNELQGLYKKAKEVKTNQLNKDDLAKFKTLTDFVLAELDLAIGNRIMNQLQKFVPVYVAAGGTKEEALDFMFTRKVLAKVEGRYEEYVKNALINLDKLISKQYGRSAFKDSRQLIAAIIKRL